MSLLDLKNKVYQIINTTNAYINKYGEGDSRTEEVAKKISMLEEVLKFFNEKGNISALEEIAKRKGSYPIDYLGTEINNDLSSVEKYLKFDMSSVVEENNHIYSYLLDNNLHSLLLKLVTFKWLTTFNVLKFLIGHVKNIIILGPNGSGKSTFANCIRKSEKHVKVIQAFKPLKAVGNISLLYNIKLDDCTKELFENDNIKEDLLLKLIIGLCNEHDEVARCCYNKKNQEVKSKFLVVSEIFEKFFSIKLLDNDFIEKRIKVTKDGINIYDFDSMSDGERSAFFYIASVITAPRKSFILIDEPENHLNPAIYNKLWDELINSRTDCQFIFISHTVNFINSRCDFELVKIKNFTHPDKFEFDFLGDKIESVDPNFIVEIVGSRKKILFCEGDNKNSLDYKIYEILLSKYFTILPVGFSKEVKNNVIACNNLAITKSISDSYGLIDNDLRSYTEIKSLKDKKIFTLSCLEIEMILADEDVFKSVLEFLNKDNIEDIISKYKEKFFKKLFDRREVIIKRYIKKIIDQKLSSTVLDEKMIKIQNNTSFFYEKDLNEIVNNNEIKTKYKKITEYVDNAISRKDYKLALNFCCLEHNEVLCGICNNIINNNYINIALGVIRLKDDLKKMILDKYLPDLYQEVLLF